MFIKLVFARRKYLAVGLLVLAGGLLRAIDPLPRVPSAQDRAKFEAIKTARKAAVQARRTSITEMLTALADTGDVKAAANTGLGILQSQWAEEDNRLADMETREKGEGPGGEGRERGGGGRGRGRVSLVPPTAAAGN